MNASAAIPIETARDERPGTADGAATPVRARFLKEAHHRQYGRPWGMGRYVFDFLVDAGLRPEHRLLDFGCGALRVGNWAIPYLDEGNYHGVEAHLVSLEAAATYEIPLNGLAGKRPRLLWDGDFAFAHFGTTFDWILDFSSSQSEKGERLKVLYGRFAEVLAPGGRLLIMPRPGVPIEELAQRGWAVVRSEVVQRCPLLEGHDDFHSDNVWWELARS